MGTRQIRWLNVFRWHPKFLPYHPPDLSVPVSRDVHVTDSHGGGGVPIISRPLSKGSSVSITSTSVIANLSMELQGVIRAEEGERGVPALALVGTAYRL